MDGLMLYHYMNIASPRISNQLSVLAFKFHPNLTIFRRWTILQIPLNTRNLDSIPARTSPSKTKICCLVHQCSPYLLVESPVLKPIEPQLVKQYHEMATSKVLVCFPKRCNRRISCFSTLVLANSGSCGLSGKKWNKHIYTKTLTACKKESL